MCALHSTIQALADHYNAQLLVVVWGAAGPNPSPDPKARPFFIEITPTRRPTRRCVLLLVSFALVVWASVSRCSGPKLSAVKHYATKIR